MNRVDDRLDAEVKAALAEFISQEDGRLGATVAAIVNANHEKGRVRSFVSGNGLTVDEYIVRVRQYYQQYQSYLDALQIQKDDAEWLSLFAKMQQWAFRFLRQHTRTKFLPHRRRVQLTHDCATEACAVLLHAVYPYDVEFDPWAVMLQQNVCLKWIDRQFKPRFENEKREIEADAWDGWLQNMRDPQGEYHFRRVDKRLELLDAVSQMQSTIRQQFIILYYFEAKTFAEISAIMGKSRNTLYKLHADSLDNLRKILHESWNK